MTQSPAEDTEEVRTLKDENAKLRALNSRREWIDKFYGRALALPVGLVALWFLLCPVSTILTADIRANSLLEKSVVITKAVDNSDQKTISTHSPTKSKKGTAPDGKSVSEEKTTTYTELAWGYGIKVFGNIAVLLALLWTAMSLIRSDQRD